ncbi:MAG: hypothetical protein KF708_09105 [Pirellulales bacterium]|nr:hypothetical protein [Pirellulales bacterium]
MHAAAAVLFSLFVVTADNQPAPARNAATARQPIVVAASVPTLPTPSPAPVEATPVVATPPTQHRVAAPTVASAPVVTQPIVLEAREEVRMPAMVGNTGFSPASKMVMQFRVKDHTVSPTATSTELEEAASIGLMTNKAETEPQAEQKYVSKLPTPPLPDASPVVVAAEPVSPDVAPAPSPKFERAQSAIAGFSENPATTPSLAASSVEDSGAAERNSFFNELKNGVQAGINKVMPASHNNTSNTTRPTESKPVAKNTAPVSPKPIAKKPTHAVEPAAKLAAAKPAPTAKAVATQPTQNFVRPANKVAKAPATTNQQHHSHADHVVAAPRPLPHATPAAATTRTVQQNQVTREPGRVLPPTVPNPSVSNPAASNGPLTGPGPFDYLYTGQEMPPWVRPYDEDPNLRNFWYHTEPRLKHGKVPHCCSTCNLLPHVEYFPEAHANYYFRPYTFTRLLQQQDQAARMGINPALPYSNDLYEKVYAEFDARKRVETVHPGEMPGEMQEFETDTEAPAPPSLDR